MSKITLLAEKTWIIRSTQTWNDDRTKVVYYETPSIWNGSPMEATIFQNYESAQAHLNMTSQSYKRWADGRKEVFDIVSLHTEILTSPNAKRIQI